MMKKLIDHMPGTEAEIQQQLKRFPDSSVSACSGHQKLAPIPMDRQLPDGDWSTSGRVNSCKVSPKVQP